ncbi:MAG: trehalose-phosphatase [Phycisphaerales bacterium]
MNEFSEGIAALVSAPILLIASDFDGTLAELVSTPDVARPNPQALEALRQLGAMPRTFAAVVSGRALADLSLHLPDAKELKLFGSHGGEGLGRVPPLSEEQERTLEAVNNHCRTLAEQFKGALVESKPFGVALHYRGVDRTALPRLLQEIHSLAERFPGARRLRGIELAEFMVIDADKGRCLKWLRFHAGAQRTLFLGDDFTDESAFAVLGPLDIGIKVGHGESVAGKRTPDPAGVASILVALAAARKEALAKRVVVPIQNYAIIADQRTVGLLAPDASIQWLCLPRLDSPSAFASALGDDSLGYFRIAPVRSNAAPRQTYIGDTLIVRTSWPEADVIDYFDCGEGRPFQRAGRTDLLRVVAVRAPVRIEFAPRMGYGQSRITMTEHDLGLDVSDWADPMSVFSPDVDWTIEETPSGPTASAMLTPRDRPYVVELRYGVASLRPATEEPIRRTRTAQYWSAWASSLRLPAVASEPVKRSALTLRALLYGPTGAIAAAATTSFPAPIGGERNWDYRYCWPRDACYAAQALLRLGNTGMPMKLLDWLCGVVDQLDAPDQLRPIYSLAGRELGAEATLPQMQGYLGSAPVRIGNAAAHQVQLDVFGPIVDTVAKVAEAGAPVTPEYWRLASAMAEAVVGRWTEADHGIWEVRTAKRLHTHSRVMCWLALQRASTVAELVLGARRAEWDALAEKIRQDTLARAWNSQGKYYAAHLNGTELDAAVLVMGLCGFIDPKEERFASTVNAIQRELVEGNVVRRYLYDDGLPGVEGGFLLCTAWMIESLALMGRMDEAQTMFGAYTTFQGPTGLLPEQWDPIHKIAMGNFPQAYSHIGLINCACTISDGLREKHAG